MPNFPAAIGLVLFGCICTQAQADNLFTMNMGGGSQPHAIQSNNTAGADFSFWRHERSYRQEILIGVGYTYLSTNTPDNSVVRILSFYPQLNLYAPERNGILPFFFVRALGPSYLSSRQFGDREQGRRVAFQAQVGAGLLIGDQKEWLVSISYKHFSNANLFNPNDGFDIPVLISIGRKW